MLEPPQLIRSRDYNSQDFEFYYPAQMPSDLDSEKAAGMAMMKIHTPAVSA